MNKDWIKFDTELKILINSICFDFFLSSWQQRTSNYSLSEKKVQNLSLGRYLFKRYTFVPKGCILVLVPNMHPLGTKVYLLKRYRPSDRFCTFFSETIVYQQKHTKINMSFVQTNKQASFVLNTNKCCHNLNLIYRA